MPRPRGLHQQLSHLHCPPLRPLLPPPLPSLLLLLLLLLLMLMLLLLLVLLVLFLVRLFLPRSWTACVCKWGKLLVYETLSY